MANELDRRIWATDPQRRLAEVALQGRLTGEWEWVTPRPGYARRRLSLRAQPEDAATQVSEALGGEALELLWESGDWVRVRTVTDRYLGWARLAEVASGEWPGDLTVTALRAHAFAGPKVSQPILGILCLGERLARGAGDAVEEELRRWLPVDLPDGRAGYVQEAILKPLTETQPGDLAQRLLETPYVWGGRSAWGLDCSGLTGLVYAALGRALPRDADQQQAALRPVSAPQAGDLAFFPGHVGLMLDERRMIHANATHMRVTIETLGEGDYGRRLLEQLSGYGRWPA